jgi:hypothetical protein|tara:strand:+ start:150 stop:851 length:702 start_codon:yes stop_codon:yes gene_type:complete
MALPKLDTPIYETQLPSTNETIKYRPFLVKEQKVLMIAQESNDEVQVTNAMMQLVSACTFETMHAETAPLFDIEHIFLKIRSVSVGEKVTVNITCPDDDKTMVKKEIDLKDVKCIVDDNHTNIVEITPTIKLEMTYPTIHTSQGTTNSDTETVFKMIDGCIAALHHGDIIHKRIDITKKEMTEFLEDLTVNQLELIMNFFNTMPRLRHVVEITNPKTKVKSEVLLEGLQTFLG